MTVTGDLYQFKPNVGIEKLYIKQVENGEVVDLIPLSDYLDNLGLAIVNKQDLLVSGTNIKTINSTSLLGEGNVSVQPTLVSGTNIKTVNNTSLLGEGNITVQPTLISGTNIKTINGASLLGEGNVGVQATLVSGTNIKTINSTSLLGSDNILIIEAYSGTGEPSSSTGKNGDIYIQTES